MPVQRVARAAHAAIGRHWALLLQGLFADGVVFPLLTPDRPGRWPSTGLDRNPDDPDGPTSPTMEAPSALRPASTSASAYLKSD
jgi:hypothetical protein